MQTLAVGLGAAIGGIARLWVTNLVVSRTGVTGAPYATMCINISGSFLIGVVIELARTRTGLPPLFRLFLATGVLGGYTTFSTFSIEALSLGTSGLLLDALIYVGGSLALGLVGAAAGIFVARAL